MTVWRPDFYIFLRSKPSECFKGGLIRGRPQDNLDQEYLTKIDQKYRELQSTLKKSSQSKNIYFVQVDQIT